MSGKPSLDSLLGYARAAHERGEEYISQVTYVGSRGVQVQASFRNQSHAEMIPALIGLLRMLQSGFGAPVWIGYTTDAFSFAGPLDDRPDNLAAAFHTGDLRVFEELYALLVGVDGSLGAACQKYRWTPVDGWEWDEPADHDPTMDGVTAALQMFFARRV